MQIERIQNRRRKSSVVFIFFVILICILGWYRQYDAHREDFIERYGRSTEMWLFHGKKQRFFL